MATGYYDPNGIWQYGEDDLLSPWSGTPTAYMNKGMTSVSGRIATPWATYVPTLTGFVLGTGGSQSCLWRRNGDQIEVRNRFTFGSLGQTFPTVPSFSLPVASAPPAHPYAIIGLASFFDSNPTSIYPAYVLAAASSTTVVQMYHSTVNGPNIQVSAGGTSPTSPFTWAAGDVMSTSFTYRP